jgi:hypothetical protein
METKGWLGRALFALVVSLVLVWWRGRPADLPGAGAAEVPAGEFSGTRARQVQERLLGGGAPHPIGSPEARRVRERVEEEFVRLGLEPELQVAFACSPERICGTVENVLVRLAAAPSRRRPGALLLSTHYDSVAAGPGASDALASAAAVVEIARALLASGALDRDVILLVDDGEEADLLGAEAFLFHPWFADVSAVVNLEARGTQGLSFLFETAPGNIEVARLVPGRLERPAVSSVFYEIYQRMPNDTDFSVFKRAGLQGANFAFIGGGTNYHTPLDDLQHSSVATLQHQGRNALAALRAFAAAENGPAGRGNAVFFDLAQAMTLRWPVRVNWLFWALTVGIGAVAARRFRELPNGRQVISGVALAIGSLVLAGASGWLLHRGMLAAGWLQRTWVAHPTPLLVATWTLAIAAALAAIGWGRRAGAPGAWFGLGALWLVLGACAAWFVPGAAHLFLVPALLSVLAAAILGRPVASLPAFAAGVLLWPFAIRLYEALGTPALAAISLLVGLVVATAAPALVAAGTSSGWLGRGALGAALVALVAAGRFAMLPMATVDVPERLNLLALAVEGEPAARLLASPETGVLPASLARTAAWKRAGGVLPWSLQTAMWNAPFELPAAPAPQAQVVESTPEGSGRRVKLLLTSQRDAPILTLWLPANLKFSQLTIQELTPPGGASAKPASRRAGWQPISVVTAEQSGVLIEMRLEGADSVTAILVDRQRELPPEAAAIARARPGNSVPSGTGDGWLIARRVTF